MNYESLIGKRFINLVRCSTDGQRDTSIPDQLALLNAFAAKHCLLHVDDVLLEGVSGSLPGNRSDLQRLVARKKERDDYDVLLVQDTTRLTRGGVEHGAKVEFDFNAVGISVVFVADQLPDGDFGGVVKSFLYFSGKQAAKSTALVSTRGCQSSLEQGRSAHCRRPPYGIDKAYVAPDGTWLHVIRTLPDGIQLKLHPETREVIGTFGQNASSGGRSHYVKQKDERVILIPGDPAQVRVVNRIFRRWLADGWGPIRIAEELNIEGIPSPWNSVWGDCPIYAMLRNPIYLGVGVANRYTRAIYYQRAPNQPKPALADPKLLTRRTPSERIRPSCEWFERAEPHLVNFLDEDLREPARLRQEKYWEARSKGYTRPPRDRHVNSPFVLKGLLRSKQGGYPMTGRVTGKRGKYHRYYRVVRSLRFPTKGTIYSRFVRADEIEQAVLGALREALAAKADVREKIAVFVKDQTKLAVKDRDDLDDLIEQRKTQVEKIEFAIETLSVMGREAARAKIAQLERSIAALDARIEQAQKLRGSETTASSLADAVVAELESLHDDLESMAPELMRELLSILVGRLEVDLETLEVEIALRLPPWAMESADKIKEALCLQRSSARKTEAEAQDEAGMSIGRFACAYRQSGRCFDCKRRRAAA